MSLEQENTHLIRSLFQSHEFYDLAADNNELEPIDVIIPVLHSNDLWRENLISFYREIPINRILIGDAGCIDDTISTAAEFPRVEILDHKRISTLGASIADLISHVKTSQFAYLQSDVYLPRGWYVSMEAKLLNFAWVGSPMQVVTMLDYKVDYSGRRPLAGAQMGITSAFDGLGDFIDDDFVYRQEDFVLEEFVRRNGLDTGNSFDTFHFHQVMRRKTNGMQMNVESISIKLAESNNELDRVSRTQLYGFLKYCNPNIREVRLAAYGAYQEQRIGALMKLSETLKFAMKNNRRWISLILRFALKHFIVRVIQFLSSVALRITDTLLRTR
jgi:hypothetical protein